MTKSQTQIVGGSEMDIRCSPFNSPIMIGIAKKYRGDTRRPCRLHIQRGITDIPDGESGGLPHLRQREMQRGWIRLVARCVASANYRTKEAAPAKVGNFTAQEAASLIGNHALRPCLAGLQNRLYV